MRAGMSEDRLTSLALMRIHYDRIVNIDRVVDLSAEMHRRRFELSTMLFESRDT